MQVNRRLYRCRENRQLAGVAAGVAEFFDLDPTLVRVLWFLSIFAGGFTILLYIGLAIIVPLEPLPAGTSTVAGPDADGVTDATVSSAIAEPEGHRHERGGGSGRVTTFVGIALILFGGLALVDAVLPSWADSWRYLWPLFFLGIGAVLVAAALRRSPTES
jgi:phage shock protein PspC (stress-responsive transcriptional regulator)